MATSNGTVGQTGNDFIISEQYLIMHCKFTNALYQTCPMQLTKSRTVYCITRCEKIIEHTGTPVNIDEKDN
jgi:hypothetical protein